MAVRVERHGSDCALREKVGEVGVAVEDGLVLVFSMSGSRRVRVRWQVVILIARLVLDASDVSDLCFESTSVFKPPPLGPVVPFSNPFSAILAPGLFCSRARVERVPAQPLILLKQHFSRTQCAPPDRTQRPCRR